MFVEFKKSTSGNVAIMFGLTVSLLALGVAVAVDASQAFSAKRHLKDLTDQSALAAGTLHRGQNQSDENTLREAESLLLSKISSYSKYHNSEISATIRDDNILQLTATSVIKNNFGRIMGKEDLLISSLSEVNLDGLSYEPAEFSIVVDATVSMSGRLRDSLRAATNIIQRIQDEAPETYITLVPFQDSVNIGPQNIAWVSTPQEYGTSNLGPSDWQTDWEGCIGPREEPESGFNWAVTNTLPEDMAFPAEIPRFESRERQVCLRVPITGPTQDTNEILSAIPNLRSNNTYQPGSNASGRLDTAMAWGWRTLSPAWRGKWGSANIPSTDRKKFLVFFSDGYTNIYNSDMDGSNSWGSNEGSETGFEHLVETCQKAKSDNIEIHIITIDPNPNVVSYFEQCATNLDTLHVLPDVDGIESIFENIALGLSQEEPLRLLR